MDKKLKKEFLKKHADKVEKLDPLSFEAFDLLVGWLGAELALARKKLNENKPVAFASPLVISALEIYGLTEIRGEIDEALIVEMFRSAGHSYVKDDETAWCSAFMCWLCNRNNFESTQKLNARSWLKLENEIEAKEMKVGDIILFWRVSPDDWRGHVGLYISQTQTHYYVLGGNQSNRVQISKYPKKQFLGARRPKRV